MVASAAVAGLLGKPVWAALCGAGLVLVYWGLEMLTWRRARSRRDLALGLALGGAFTRLVIVLAALVVIGLLDRPAFATAALAFLAAFTGYLAVRPFTYPETPNPAGQAGAS